MRAMRRGSHAMPGMAAALMVCLWMAGAADALPVADDYNRPNNSDLGSTPVGGVMYEEFIAAGGDLLSSDAARVESGRVRFDGAFYLFTDPAQVRLAGVGFDLDVTAEGRFLADGYDPDDFANAAIFTFRQGMDPGVNSVFTKGAVHLVILPNGTYIIEVVTVSGNLVFGPPPTILFPVDRAPIGPAFLATDTNGNGVLDSNEPFTLRGKIAGNVFCWFMNGVQIGQPLVLPDDAMTGVSTIEASNFLFGRTRAAAGAALDVAFDNLSIQAPVGSCAAGPLEIAMDIKPGGGPNSINPRSKGVIPVAILTSPTFDARTVDPNTVKFGPNGAKPVHAALEDVDGDGDLDLILHFNTQATGIACGDTQAGLTGLTTGGQAIVGMDAISTVGCR